MINDSRAGVQKRDYTDIIVFPEEGAKHRGVPS
jgi:hypothetical protein